MPALVMAAKLAGASVLDKSERQVLVVVEDIQDLVVRVTERAIFRSLLKIAPSVTRTMF